MAQLNFGGVTETVVIRDEFPLEKAPTGLKRKCGRYTFIIRKSPNWKWKITSLPLKSSSRSF